MSIFKKARKSGGALVNFAAALQTESQRKSFTTGVDTNVVSGMIGLESLSAMQQQSLEGVVASGWQVAVEAAREANFNMDKLSDAQIEAGQIIIAASVNPAAYAKSAMTKRAVGTESIPLIDTITSGAGGTFDFRDEIHEGLEAFDNTSLSQYIGYSIAFNIQAARQDDYAEAFYPTVVVTPDQGGLDITARLQTVFNEVRHSITGKPTDFNQKNLLEAIVDASILAADALKIVPYYLAGGGGSSANFVPTSRVPSTNATVETVTFPTGPLLINTKIDLLGVSQHPGLVATGVLDNTDALDGKIILSNVYIAFQAGAGGEEVVKFDTLRLNLSHFNKTAEGRDRKMGLQFQTSDLVLDATTADIGGGNLAVFDAFQALGYSLRLTTNIFGFADVEFGTVEVNAGPVSIAGIYDANGNRIDEAAAGVPAAITALGAIQVIGYDLDARRTNSNRRTRGLLCNSQTFTERYNIPIGSPLSIPTPLNSDTEAGDINTLVTAARIRNSNMAVTALLNYADLLKQYVSVAVPGQLPNIMGIGRYFVTPYYKEELNIDFTTKINSIQSHQRIADLRSAFVTTLRKHAYNMLQNSRYKVALDQLTGFTGAVPTLLVGTDPILNQYLMADGDSRTIGPDISYKSVVSYDSRLRGTIFLTFVRPDEVGPSPLNFGVHAWVPEMTSAVQVQRNGAVIKEVMVQPRNVHINTLPVLTKITVNMTALEQAIADKTEAPTLIV
jgi:hypothetical protein